MENKELNKLLLDNINIRNHEVENVEWSIKGLRFLKLRDILIVIGKIAYEDLENQVYIAIINGGWFKRNRAYTAFHLSNDTLKIAITADEGLFNQHTCKGVLNELRKSLEKYINE